MDELLHHGLRHTAQRQPEAVALVERGRSWTYGELLGDAHRTAWALREHGIGRGDRVAVCLPKGAAAVASIHGVLEAGGAYVPVDPRFPARRRSFILRDCAVGGLVVDADDPLPVAELVRDVPSVRLVIRRHAVEDADPTTPVRILSEAEFVACDSTEAPPDTAAGNDIAYVLYTSGSTGTPKGVVITHLNSLSFVQWAGRTFGLGRDDRVAGHAPLHFDLSVFDVFNTLASGATLCPVPEALPVFPATLLAWLAEQRISVSYSVPSLLVQLARQPSFATADLSALRQVLFAGEVFPARSLRAWMEKLPNAAFHNLYGPTETNVVTHHRLVRIPAEGEDVPIGKACAGASVTIVASDGQTIDAAGSSGELVVHGPTVAEGYWGDPERTRAAFLPSRGYRTGDIVRRDERGDLVFVGRRDRMIKRLGHRIELGEIESVLRRHPEVEDALVRARPEDGVGHRIEAFVVAPALQAPDLRAFLALHLPRFMLPDSIEARAALPRTASGKLDPAAL